MLSGSSETGKCRRSDKAFQHLSPSNSPVALNSFGHHVYFIPCMDNEPREVPNRPSWRAILAPVMPPAIVVGTNNRQRGFSMVPAEMMQSAGSAKLVYLGLARGRSCFPSLAAITYAELGAMKPQAGGEYVYIRDGYGPLTAFLYAWTWFLIAKPASIATLATGFVRVLGTFPGFAFSGITTSPRTHLSRLPTASFWLSRHAILISALNYIGIKKSSGTFNWCSRLLKVVIILSIVVIGFSFSGASWQNFATTLATGAKGGMAAIQWPRLLRALWA